MKKTSQRELDPREALLLKQTEELRNHLLGNDGIRAHSVDFTYGYCKTSPRDARLLA